MLHIKLVNTKVEGDVNKLQEINAKQEYFHFLNDETYVQISNSKNPQKHLVTMISCG